MSQRKHNRNSRLGAFTLLLLIITFVVDWFFPFDPFGSSVRLIPHAIRIAVLIVFVAYLLGKHSAGLLSNPVLKATYAWIAYVAIHMILVPNTSSSPLSLLILFSRGLFWIIVFSIIYKLASTGRLEERTLAFWIGAFAVLICSRLLIWRFSGIWIGNTSIFGAYAEVAKSPYLVIWFIPILIILQQRSWVSKIGLFTSIWTVIISQLRGGILALFSIFIVYTAYTFAEHKTRLKQVGKFILILVIVSVAASFEIDQLTERMDDLSDPDNMGSGRGQFYKIILQAWANGTFFDKVFGVGFYSVPDLLAVQWKAGIYAHSDWLETLYDLGILGCCFLAAIHITIIIQVWRLWRSKDTRPAAATLGMGYAALFVMNATQQIFFASETALFGVLAGYVLGTCTRAQRVTDSNSGRNTVNLGRTPQWRQISVGN